MGLLLPGGLRCGLCEVSHCSDSCPLSHVAGEKNSFDTLLSHILKQLNFHHFLYKLFFPLNNRMYSLSYAYTVET